MARRNRKEDKMTGDGVSTKDTWKQKRPNNADSSGTKGALEGQNLEEN